MAEILPFTKRAGKETRKRPVGPAEIVIFPGVRVEYHLERKPARKRRRPTARQQTADDILTA